MRHFALLGEGGFRVSRETSEPAAPIQLGVFTSNRGQPTWPAEILQKFPAGTEEYKKLAELKAKFDLEFPSTIEQPTRDAETRATGACDYSVNGGVRPVDLDRTGLWGFARGSGSPE